MTREEREREGEREGERGTQGEERKEKCKRREGVKNEVMHCINKVGGSWKVESVKVDLVWV